MSICTMRDKIGFLKCFGSLKVLVSLQELFVVFFINVILNQKHRFATVYSNTLIIEFYTGDTCGSS